MKKIILSGAVLLLLQGCGKGTSNNIQNKDENQQDNIEKIELIKVSGAVIDGYIDNSIVFLDENKNYILDKNEIFTNTNIDGKYQLSIPKNLEGNIVAIQGVDTISGKKNTFTFSSNLDFHDNQSIFLNGYTTLANINNIRNDKYNFDITSNLDIFQKSVKIINSINLIKKIQEAKAFSNSKIQYIKDTLINNSHIYFIQNDLQQFFEKWIEENDDFTEIRAADINDFLINNFKIKTISLLTNDFDIPLSFSQAYVEDNSFISFNNAVIEDFLANNSSMLSISDFINFINNSNYIQFNVNLSGIENELKPFFQNTFQINKNTTNIDNIDFIIQDLIQQNLEKDIQVEVSNIINNMEPEIDMCQTQLKFDNTTKLIAQAYESYIKQNDSFSLSYYFDAIDTSNINFFVNRFLEQINLDKDTISSLIHSYPEINSFNFNCSSTLNDFKNSIDNSNLSEQAKTMFNNLIKEYLPNVNLI